MPYLQAIQRQHLALVLILLGGACTRSPQSEVTNALMPDAGAGSARQPFFLRKPTVEVPLRIVSLAPNVTEIIFALEAGDRLVGVTRFCDYPTAAQSLPKVGGFLDPSLEAVAALKPDLIITVPNGQNRVVVERLAEMGFAALLTYAYDIDDVQNSIVAIGAAIGRADAAQVLVSHMQADLQKLRQLYASQHHPRVLFLYGHRPLVAAGPGSYAQQLLDIIGADNVMAASKSRYPTLSLETVIGYAPDVIIDAYQGGHGETDDSTFAQFTTIPAVRNGRIYRLQDGVALHPGPRAAADAKILAALIHPQATP